MRTSENDFFCLDEVTCRDLNILANRSSKGISRSSFLGSKGSGESKSTTLFNVINHCRTKFGKRTLQEWILRPLKRVDAILARQNAVKWAAQTDTSSLLSTFLDHVCELESLVLLLHSGKISCKKMVSLLSLTTKLGESLEEIVRIGVDHTSAGMKGCDGAPDTVISGMQGCALTEMAKDAKGFLSQLNRDAATANDIQSLFVPAALAKYSKAHDTDKALRAHMAAIDAELLRVRRVLKSPSLEFKTLKISTTNKLEFLIEQPKNTAVPEDWILINETQKFSRYHTTAIVQLTEDITRARDELKIALDEAFFDYIASLDRVMYVRYHTVIIFLGQLDALFSLGCVSKAPGCVFPSYSSGSSDVEELLIEGARHPLVERIMADKGHGQEFIANDVHLTPNFGRRSTMVLSGPNMGGKSVYCSAVALISLLGAIGSSVPAVSAKLYAFDNILTRMGSSDDLASGQSSFEIELQRTSMILRTATPKSLVIFDELGRGTGTNDGVSIALATLKYSISCIGCVLMFVTHYSTIIDSVGEGALHCHMSYMEDGDGPDGEGTGNVTFLFKCIESASKGSYGLNCARIAGLDERFLALAKRKSDEVAPDERVPYLTTLQAVDH
jgi:DNA mismatch repair protein MSH3